MITNVTFKDNGDIEIDNSELLDTRADMSDEIEDLQNPNIGGSNILIEKDLKKHKKRLNWNEPNREKRTHVLHVCAVCGTQYYGRPNKIYCGTPCKETAKKRRQRERKRANKE